MAWPTPDQLTPLDTTYHCGYSKGAVTIANGASLSGAIDLGWATLVGLLMPASWTSALVSFAVSLDGVTYGPLQDVAGEVVTQTLAGGEFVTLAPLTFFGCRAVKVRSGSAGSAVAQGADRIMTLLVKNLN